MKINKIPQIKIYNSLTKKKEDFIPASGKNVKMYTCGVTVYDDCHIGHARSLYIFEVIRRYLQYRGFKVSFIRNITDIDDKIIKRANELKVSWKELVDKYINDYYQDLSLLNIPKADKEPRATANITAMIRYIKKLIDKGYAYETKDGIYFRVRRFKSYGKLSNQSIDQMLEGVRVEVDEHKEDPLDFALWKKSKENEPFWNSPWGRGRPGWHIECSVMSQKYLKAVTLDIHGGGRDLIFPHHENECAQSEALSGKPFANYWIHHGLLTINSQKMAKSLGNFITIKDFVKKYKDPDYLKLFFLSAHYSHPVDFNEEKIEEFKKQKKSFYDTFEKFFLSKDYQKGPKIIPEDKDKVDVICAKFNEAMDDDFNMPGALASLFDLIDLGSVFASLGKKEALKYVVSKLEEFFKIFGLKIPKGKKIPKELIKLADKRHEARQKKDFKAADAIRKEMEEKFPYYATDSATSTIFISKKLPEED
ncbi:MAG: cysteine--tRNA ligase [Candidatus Omnitrophica bacterium]|jgi:cysteinyl-tRNA synthetase|nr:cysteine--tRNA ligase [Candidatus Omnitrophota bacterium]